MTKRKLNKRTQKILTAAATLLLAAGVLLIMGLTPQEIAQVLLGDNSLPSNSQSVSSHSSTPAPSDTPPPGEVLGAGSVRVHTIDVGQALCVLIQTPDTAVLIDGGENETAEQTVAYLQEQGVTELDYVFNTHPHYDHFGGLRNIMKEVPAKAYYSPKIPNDLVPTVVSYEKLLTFLEEKGLKITVPKVGEAFDLGSGAVLTVIAPQKVYDDLNESSLVLRLTVGNHAFLITGDIENGSERDIVESGMEIKSDVLVLPHHGSSTSILQAFVKEVDPQYGIISCGKDNKYGHPHQKTLDLYEKLATKLLRTDELGTIVFETDGKTLEYYSYAA